MSKQAVIVEGMHCSGCANSVKTKFETLSNVTKVEMDLEGKKAIIEAEHELTAEELNTVLEETTYEVIDVNETA